MALLIIIISAVLASIVNFCTKKNLEKMDSSQGYLVIYFSLSLIGTLVTNPKIAIAPFSSSIFTVGAITGVMLFAMMIALPKALKHGPPGLTFAFQNASSIMPSLLLFFLFGAAFNFELNVFTIIGASIIILGLVIAASPQILHMIFRRKYHTDAKQEFTSAKLWAFYMILVFLLQTCILSMFHWRSLLIDNGTSHPLLFVNSSLQADFWFLPGMFTVATLLNILAFSFEKRWFTKSELIYGSIGGFLNAMTSFGLLWGVDIASKEKKILFPVFAVATIIFCSLWGYKIYKERINWLAIILCILGIFLATF